MRSSTAARKLRSRPALDSIRIVGGEVSDGTLCWSECARWQALAIVGFNTADCRAWLQANAQRAPQPAPSSLLVPAPRCPIRGDTPLLCSSGASSESSALVLDEARR